MTYDPTTGMVSFTDAERVAGIRRAIAKPLPPAHVHQWPDSDIRVLVARIEKLEAALSAVAGDALEVLHDGE